MKGKYRWLSSVSKEMGTPINSSIHFIGKVRDVMYLTEGALKADVTYALCKGKRSFFALAGVNIMSQLKETLAELKSKGAKKIMIAFDMDRLSNDKVAAAIKKVTDICSECGLDSGVCTWDIEKGKGIDDLMLNWIRAKGYKKQSV